MASDGRTTGDALKALLVDEMTAERARKQSLESRALAVITSAGTLVTLLLGLAALSTKATNYSPTLATSLFASAAATLFVVSAIFAIYSSAPGRYYEIDPESLSSLTEAHVWASPSTAAERELAIARIGVLGDWRKANQRKASILACSAATEVLAIAAAAAATFLILLVE